MRVWANSGPVSCGRNWFLLCYWLVSAGCISPNYKGPIEPRILSSIAFESKVLEKGGWQVANWHRQKLIIGSNEEDAYEFLTATVKEQPQRIRVETCEQYLRAIREGAYAVTTFDLAMEIWFIRATAALQFMAKAQPAKRSFLPSKLIPHTFAYIAAELGDERIQQPAHLRKKASFESGGRRFSIEELARGDMDQDGCEDALLFVSWRYMEGSGLGYQLLIASRPRSDLPMRVAVVALTELRGWGCSASTTKSLNQYA